MATTRRGVDKTASPDAVVWASDALKSLLASVFDGMNGDARKQQSPEDYDRRRGEFVFHMTDWLNDLQRLNEIYARPDKVKLPVAERELAGFLYHVIPHLNSAGRLLLGEISDPFDTANKATAPDKAVARRRQMRKSQAS